MNDKLVENKRQQSTLISNFSKGSLDNSYEKLNLILESLSLDKKVRSKPEFANLVNFSDYKEHPVHRWFKYREGYSTTLIKNILESKKNLRRVLDPFCGSGTTLIASKELGIDSIGFEINPLASFVSQVKTQDYSKEDIKTLTELATKILDISNARAEPSPNLKIISKIFNSDILDTLLKIKYNISLVNYTKHQDFLKLGWLSILEEVSNTRKEGNGIKYKFTKRTKNGYIGIPQNEWEDKFFGDNKENFVIKKLEEKYHHMITDVENNSLKKSNTKIYNESSLYLTNFLEENSVSIAIFSPPYANCFDYFEIFKVELWMGDFVKTYDELKVLRSSALRSNTNAKMDIEGREFHFEELYQIIDLIDEDSLWNKNIKKVIKGYFEDMHLVLKEIFNVLEADGECIIVVGNSAYGGVVVPTDLLLAEIGRQIGFSDVEIFPVRHLTASSQQREKLKPFLNYMRESIVVLKKAEYLDLISVEELPISEKIPKKQKYFINSNDVAYCTHNIHKYPAKFIPHVPRWGLKKYQLEGKTNIILDPFCGSGTTLVESMLLGHHAYGIDIDPLSRLISKVKTTRIEDKRLLSLRDEVITKVNNKKNGLFKPSIPTLHHWFNKENTEKLSIIRDVIEEYKEDKDLYDFLIICMSSIIRRASNADNQSQKTYVSHTNPKEPEDAFQLFFKNLTIYTERIISLSNSAPSGAEATVFEDCINSTSFAKYWYKTVNEEADIVITSPPYIKAVDYIYNQMAELFWIGDLFSLETQKLQNEYKKNYVGTKQVPASVYSERIYTNYEVIDSIVDKIYTRSPHYAYITAKFFLDIEKNINEVNKVLKDKGHYLIVIGNNSVSGTPVNSSEFIVEIARNNGFNLDNLFSYEIRNRYMRFPRKGRGGLIKEDWIIDLEKV